MSELMDMLGVALCYVLAAGALIGCFVFVIAACYLQDKEESEVKLRNFTIRGKCLNIVGRIVSCGEKDKTLYDIEFPEDLESMSIEELRKEVAKIEEDIESLFYSDGKPLNSSIRDLEDALSQKTKDGDTYAN